MSSLETSIDAVAKSPRCVVTVQGRLALGGNDAEGGTAPAGGRLVDKRASSSSLARRCGMRRRAHVRWRAPALALFVVAALRASPAVAQEARGFGFQEARVTTPDGVRLYVRIVGNGPDTVVIGSAAYLAADLARLQFGRTLIFYDQRSRGGSDAVADPSRLSMQLEVSDIEAVRIHFGIGRFSLIGWSYFGAVVALYASQYPAHIRAVVQISPMAARRSGSADARGRGSPPGAAERAFVARLKESGVDVSDPVRYCREATLRLLLRPMMGRPDSAGRSMADPCVYWNEWPQQVFATISKFIPPVRGGDWDYSSEATQIRSPVLVLHGTNDPNAPIEGGREWTALIPHSRLIEMEGVGHAPWLESPSRFFPAVDSFLRDQLQLDSRSRERRQRGRDRERYSDSKLSEVVL